MLNSEYKLKLCTHILRIVYKLIKECLIKSRHTVGM